MIHLTMMKTQMKIKIFLKLSMHNLNQSWSESRFLDSYPSADKVTPAPALKLIENLHSDSCLHFLHKTKKKALES